VWTVAHLFDEFVDLLLDLEGERDVVGVVELEVVQLLGRERKHLCGLQQQRLVDVLGLALVHLLDVGHRQALLHI
jgi:hypothetical protein